LSGGSAATQILTQLTTLTDNVFVEQYTVDMRFLNVFKSTLGQ